MPVVLLASQKDQIERTVSVEIGWRQKDSWQSQTMDRALIANKTTIVKALAQYGIAVTTHTAGMLVAFLADFETENAKVLPNATVTRRLGWQGKNVRDGFLWGRDLLVGSATTEVQSISFRGADEGDDQIADAFRRRGKPQTWIRTIRAVRNYPQVMLGVYASLAAPMLRVLTSPNFLVSFAGKTSSGKTTALRVAASVWGNPNEQDTSSVVRTWSGTAVWRERVPSVLGNLPFIVDDTKHATNRDDVAKTIYAIHQGVGKGRGSKTGLAKQATWQTVALISGEQPLTSFSKDGGTRARVLSLWGSPFGSQNSEVGDLVRRVDNSARRNYGHAGPQLIEHLIDNRRRSPAWRTHYRQQAQRFERLAATVENPYAGRMATHFAAITTTAWIVHEAGILPWDYTDPIEPLWNELVREAGEANQAAAAFQFAYEWAVANQTKFVIGGGSSEGEPHGGWAGRWNEPGESGKGEEWIGFIPERLQTVLSEGGYDYDAVVPTWRDEGWLVTGDSEDAKRRRRMMTRVGRGNKSVGVIALQVPKEKE